MKKHLVIWLLVSVPAVFSVYHFFIKDAKMPVVWDWKTANFKAQELPLKELTKKSGNVKITEQKITIQTYELFYRRTLDSTTSENGLTVLFLHGKKFKSETWLNLKTIHLVAAMGHKVIAIDLPGYGLSGKNEVPEPERAEFLHELIKKLEISPCVIISPSLSGSFSIPMLRAHPDNFKAYIPVAPIRTGTLTEEEYKNIQVPTMIVCGENDKDLGEESIKNLSLIPTSQVLILPKAGHAAYFDQPDLFHQLLFNFLALVDKSPKN